jgi:GNAT superfamily N-acetyltransferase
LNDDFIIRQGTLDDLDVIVRHRIGMFRDMCIPAPQLAIVEPAARAYFERAIPAGYYRAFLAETREARVVAGGGIVILDWPGSAIDTGATKAMILNMYTEAEFRRRGLARRLMQAMLDWCRNAGYKTVSLHASQYGRPLYESMGFKPTNEMRLTL